AGGRAQLRLLNDPVQIERTVDRQVREHEARAAHEHPGPRQAERDHQDEPVGEREAHQLAARERATEARGLEEGVLPEVTGLLRREPEPVEPQWRDEQQRGQTIRAEEVLSAPVEVEWPAAAVRVRDHEALLTRLEERVIERERQGAQQRAPHEDADEVPGSPSERESYSAPRGAAEPIAPRADHGHGKEDEDQDR